VIGGQMSENLDRSHRMGSLTKDPVEIKERH
jgi:hypothetical protein